DHHVRADLAIVRYRRARVDDRRRMPPRRAGRFGIEGLGGAGERLVRLGREQQRHARRRVRGGRLGDDGGAGARGGEGGEIFAVVEKGELVGAGGLERRHVAYQPRGVFRGGQFSPADRRQG